MFLFIFLSVVPEQSFDHAFQSKRACGQGTANRVFSIGNQEKRTMGTITRCNNTAAAAAALRCEKDKRVNNNLCIFYIRG